MCQIKPLSRSGMLPAGLVFSLFLVEMRNQILLNSSNKR